MRSFAEEASLQLMVWKSCKTAFLYRERPELLLLQRAYKKQKAPTHANPYTVRRREKSTCGTCEHACDICSDALWSPWHLTHEIGGELEEKSGQLHMSIRADSAGKGHFGLLTR